MTMPERQRETDIEWGEHTRPMGLVRNQEFLEEQVSTTTGVDQDTVKLVFDEMWEAIRRQLEEGNSVKLHGKGRFYLSRRSSRIGRNPQTKEEYRVPAREAMAFQNSQAYAKRLRDIRMQRTGEDED